MKKLGWLLIVLILSLGLFSFISGCTTAADTASYNTSKAADNFQVYRKIIFYNAITDKFMYTIEGLCSLGNNDAVGELSVTCKVGPDSYVKHFLIKSDNVAVMVLQVEAINVDPFHYKIYLRPETVIPGIELQTSGGQ